MERVTLEITKMGNAAFEYPEGEVARILRELADKIEAQGLTGGVLMDYNGNKVGEWNVWD